MLDDVFFELYSPKLLSEKFEKLSNIDARGAQLEFLNILLEYDFLELITCRSKSFDCLNKLISIGYTCKSHGLLLSMGAQCFAVASVLEAFSSNALQNNIKQQIFSGKKIAAFAATEIEAGSDVMSMQTHYKYQDNGFILNGKKSYITNATTADYLFVYATKNSKLYDRGLSLFIVPRNSPGVTVAPLETEKTLTNSGLGNIIFENVFLNIDALVGKECQAAAIFRKSLKAERAYILIPHIGTMLRWHHKCIETVKSRIQFKRPLYQFQYVDDKIIEIYERIKISYLLAKDVFQQNEISDASASLIKNYIGDSLQISHMHALSILSAAGIFGENKLSDNLMDSFSASIYSGTREIQKNIILNEIIDKKYENIS